jgi:hypothetical protein
MNDGLWFGRKEGFARAAEAELATLDARRV